MVSTTTPAPLFRSSLLGMTLRTSLAAAARIVLSSRPRLQQLL
jgi:hypothetical protein